MGRGHKKNPPQAKKNINNNNRKEKERMESMKAAASSAASSKGVPMTAYSKRRNRARPLFPVDYTDSLFELANNPALAKGATNAELGEKPLQHFLWWHVGHLMNELLNKGRFPKFLPDYFRPFAVMKEGTARFLLQPLSFELIMLLQAKWGLLCTQVAADLVHSTPSTRCCDETQHVRRLLRTKRLTMHQLSGAFYELLGWAAYHSGMRDQAEILWQCGADGGHPACFVWLATVVPPASNNIEQHVYRDPLAELRQAVLHLRAARAAQHAVLNELKLMKIITAFPGMTVEGDGEVVVADDDDA